MLLISPDRNEIWPNRVSYSSYSNTSGDVDVYDFRDVSATVNKISYVTVDFFVNMQNAP